MISMGEAIDKVKESLKRLHPLIGFLSDLMVLSELYYEGSNIHLIAWLPIPYTKIHVVYNMENGKVIINEG